jgi:hypothetical protein
VNRIELEAKLNTDRAWLIETYGAMDPADLVRPATQSEHDPAQTWSAKDHLVHLILIENNFNAMVRRFLRGDGNPVGLLKTDDGRERPREEIMASVHAMTEDWAVKHRDKPLTEVIAMGQKARAETLALIAELSDEQLLLTLPGAPWGDGTIAGVLAANADHGRGHYRWVKEGWAARANS